MNMITISIYALATLLCLFHGAASMVQTTEYIEMMPNDPYSTFLSKVDALHKCCPHTNWRAEGIMMYHDMADSCVEEQESFTVFASEDLKAYVFECKRWKWIYFAEEGREYEIDKYRGDTCQYEPLYYSVSEMESEWSICVPYNFEEMDVETDDGSTAAFKRYEGALVDGYTRTIDVTEVTAAGTGPVLCIPKEEVFHSQYYESRDTYTYTLVDEMDTAAATEYVTTIRALVTDCEEYDESCGPWVEYDREDPEGMERKKRDTSSARDIVKRHFREMIKRDARK